MNILTYKGNNFTQRSSDNFVNLTEMAKCFEANIGHWTRLDKTKAYLQAVSTEIRFPTSALLYTNKGGNDRTNQGTWGHPLVALNFAQWLSPEFHVWCNMHIRTLMETGETKLHQVEAKPKLPCYEEAVLVADSIRHITDTLDDHPRLAQVLIDHAINEILESKKAIAGTEEKWRGVAEIASEMGYKMDSSSRVRLGKFIAKQGCHESKKESRLCNGTMRNINCYRDSQELRDAIRNYFTM